MNLFKIAFKTPLLHIDIVCLLSFLLSIW